jgi:hypothetical protein
VLIWATLVLLCVHLTIAGKWVSTSLSAGDYDTAMQTAFQRLFNYISTNNIEVSRIGRSFSLQDVVLRSSQSRGILGFYSVHLPAALGFSRYVDKGTRIPVFLFILPYQLIVLTHESGTDSRQL